MSQQEEPCNEAQSILCISTILFFGCRKITYKNANQRLRYTCNIFIEFLDQLSDCHHTVNVTGETLVPNKIFPGFMLLQYLLYTVSNPVFPTFPALCCENPCFMLGKFLCSTRVSPVTFTVSSQSGRGTRTKAERLL